MGRSVGSHSLDPSKAPSQPFCAETPVDLLDASEQMRLYLLRKRAAVSMLKSSAVSCFPRVSLQTPSRGPSQSLQKEWP